MSDVSLNSLRIVELNDGTFVLQQFEYVCAYTFNSAWVKIADYPLLDHAREARDSLLAERKRQDDLYNAKQIKRVVE